MSRIVGGFLLVGLFAAVSGASGDCPSCKWTDRGDRFEGIARRQVSGGCCELLGVHYQRADQLASGAERLSLFFWLPAEMTPEIVVGQRDVNYLMTPKSRGYGRGLQRFSWPRGEVLAPLRVQIDTLQARVSDSAAVYFPALLSTSDRPIPAGKYAFVLESAGALDLQCTIAREEKGRLVPVRSFRQTEEFGGVFTVEWDGRDDRGQRVAGGVYVLRLDGQVEAETIQPIRGYKVAFQHYDQFQ